MRCPRQHSQTAIQKPLDDFLHFPIDGFDGSPSGSFLAFFVPKCKKHVVSWSARQDGRCRMDMMRAGISPHRAKRSVHGSSIGLWNHRTTERAVDKPACSTGGLRNRGHGPDKSINGGWPRPATKRACGHRICRLHSLSLNVNSVFPSWVTLRGARNQGCRRASLLAERLVQLDDKAGH